jgi:hypothetical protein
MNTAKEERKVNFEKYTERISGFTKCRDIVSKEEKELKEIKVGSYKAVVLELMK